MVKQTQKLFTISKDGINRLKTLSGITNTSFIERELFVKDEFSNMFFRTSLSDIPDDFRMSVFDINSFLATYKMVEDSAIDYTHLDDENYIKIVSNKLDSKTNKEFFIYRQNEEILMTNNLELNKELKVIEKMGTELNTCVLSSENIKKLLKACSVLNGNCIKITAKEDAINFKVINTKLSNSNTFDMEVKDDINIMIPDSEFFLSYDSLNTVEKEVEEYNVTFCNNSGSMLLTFENKDMGLKFYFGNFTDRK